MKLAIAAIAASTLALAACSTPTAIDANVTASPDTTVEPSAAPVLDERPLDDQLREAVLSSDVAYAQLAIDAGADVDMVDDTENSPLTLAVIRDDVDMVRALLDAGASLDQPNGAPVIDLTAAWGGYDVVMALVDAGADPNGAGDFAGGPLVFAGYEANFEVISALIDAGADPFQRLSDPEFGFFPLCAAAFGGNLEAVELFISLGEDPLKTTHDGSTCSQWADSQANYEAAAYLRAIEEAAA